MSFSIVIDNGIDIMKIDYIMHSIEKTFEKILRGKDVVLKVIELILASIMFCGSVYFSIQVFAGFLQEDWSNITTFHNLINNVLIILLGFEVVRLIIVHKVSVVIELMMLIVARKMLYPDAAGIDLIFYSLAFVIIAGVYFLYQLKPFKKLDDLT